MKAAVVALHDIRHEIAFLHSIRDRVTFEQFASSPADVRAASYSIMVISEAARRIPDSWLAHHPAMPWHAIRTIGNKLRHEYQRISVVILWGIIERHADALAVAIEDMLARYE